MLQMFQVVTCCFSSCCCNIWKMPLNVNVNGKVELRLRLLLLSFFFVMVAVMFPTSFLMLHYSHPSQSQSWLGLANLSRHLMGLNGERIRSMQSRFRLVNIRGTIHREGEKGGKKTSNRAWQQSFCHAMYITVFKLPLYPKLPRRCGNSGYDLSRIDSFLTAFIVIADKYCSFIATRVFQWNSMFYIRIPRISWNS